MRYNVCVWSWTRRELKWLSLVWIWRRRRRSDLNLKMSSRLYSNSSTVSFNHLPCNFRMYLCRVAYSRWMEPDYIIPYCQVCIQNVLLRGTDWICRYSPTFGNKYFIKTLSSYWVMKFQLMFGRDWPRSSRGSYQSSRKSVSRSCSFLLQFTLILNLSAAHRTGKTNQQVPFRSFHQSRSPIQISRISFFILAVFRDLASSVVHSFHYFPYPSFALHH